MLKTRYSFIIANRSSGAVHRLTVTAGSALATILALLAVPVWLSLQSHLAATDTIKQLKLRNAASESQNAFYRTATTELSDRIGALQLVVDQLHDQSIVAPELRQAMTQLPVQGNPSSTKPKPASALHASTETFGLINDLLNILDLQLGVAGAAVRQQRELAASTPLNLPSDGPVTARFGYRRDPFTGRRAHHPAIDISTKYGQPVMATADGKIVSAERSGAYGNLIEIDHGLGRVTRYGHLSRFAKSVSDHVKRGQIIGFAGATGRATGSHVHYEVWVDNRPINPLQLAPAKRAVAAD